MNPRLLGKIGQLSSVLAAVVCATSALAESPPGSIPVGGLYLYPALDVGYKYDDNVTLQNGAARTSDSIFVIRPMVKLEAQQGANIYSLRYTGEFGRYDRHSQLNYNNNRVDGDAFMVFDARNRLKGNLFYNDAFDQLGALNVALTATPNHYRDTGGKAQYTFGAQDAQGKLELDGGYHDKHYVNNRLVTSVLDYNQLDYGGTFLWRVMPKTYATFSLRQSKFDYNTAPLDSTDTYARVGVRWEATAATTGRFEIGEQRKRFDAGFMQGFSGVSFLGGITWSPLSYSTIDIITSRNTVDSTGVGNFSVNQLNSITWTHAWNTSLISKLGASYITDKFVNAPVAFAGGANRDDKTTLFTVGANYRVQRWLNLGAEYTYGTRDSNDPLFTYNRNLYMLFAKATL